MKPPAGTRVGDVTDALLVSLATISGVNVVDGPNPKTLPLNDTIEIGTGTISARNEKAAGLGIAYTENLTIPMRVWSFSGDYDMKSRRDRCVDLMDAVRALLTADVKLGGACDQALIGPSWAAIPYSDDTGVSYQIGFTITVKTNI
jgi:hypothetical protein